MRKGIFTTIGFILFLGTSWGQGYPTPLLRVGGVLSLEGEMESTMSPDGGVLKSKVDPGLGLSAEVFLPLANSVQVGAGTAFLHDRLEEDASLGFGYWEFFGQVRILVPLNSLAVYGTGKLGYSTNNIAFAEDTEGHPQTVGGLAYGVGMGIEIPLVQQGSLPVALFVEGLYSGNHSRLEFHHSGHSAGSIDVVYTRFDVGMGLSVQL